MTELEQILALTEIGRAAVAADHVREQAVAAREERDGLLCKCEDVDWHLRDEGPRPSGPPCWKHYDVVEVYDDYNGPDSWQELLDRGEWCDNCLARQEAHERYVILRNKLGGMRAGMARRCTHYRKGR